MLFTIFTSDAENLALNQTTWQSSTFEQGFAWKAVDGNHGLELPELFLHTSTRREQGAWWMVELDGEYIVTEVLITNRGEENFCV